MIGNPTWSRGKIVPGAFGSPHFPYDIAILDYDGQEIRKFDEVGHIRATRSAHHWAIFEYHGNPEKMKRNIRRSIMNELYSVRNLSQSLEFQSPRTISAEIF